MHKVELSAVCIPVQERLKENMVQPVSARLHWELLKGVTGKIAGGRCNLELQHFGVWTRKQSSLALTQSSSVADDSEDLEVVYPCHLRCKNRQHLAI